MKKWLNQGEINKNNMYRQICINEEGDKYTGCCALETVFKQIHDGFIKCDFVIKPQPQAYSQITQQSKLIDPIILLNRTKIDPFVIL